MNMFFDPRRYDLAKVGRYKFNKKLAISARIKGRTLAEPVADPRTGEIIANEGDAISADLAMQIERAGVNQVELLVEGKKVRVFSNNMVYLDEYVDFEVEDFPVKKVRKAIIEEILENAETEDEIKEQLEPSVRASLAVSFCSCIALLKPSTSTSRPFSSAISIVRSTGKPYVS